jgi:hypothetical protein
MDFRSFRRVVGSYASAPRADWAALSAETLEDQPRCPVSRYVAGCCAFDLGRAAMAVRQMMIAHHAEPALESAALLAFSGLSWIEQLNRPLLSVLVETWEEFRRPQFDRTRKERLLLDMAASRVSEPGHVSALARSLWRLPLESVRAQLRRLASERDAAEHPLLLAPA